VSKQNCLSFLERSKAKWSAQQSVVPEVDESPISAVLGPLKSRWRKQRDPEERLRLDTERELQAELEAEMVGSDPPVFEEADGSDAEDLYQAERILNQRVRGTETQYYVKWCGYGESDSTWEVYKNIESSPDVIEAWVEELKQRALPKVTKSGRSVRKPSKLN
jgi:hypothetical protein